MERGTGGKHSGTHGPERTARDHERAPATSRRVLLRAGAAFVAGGLLPAGRAVAGGTRSDHSASRGARVETRTFRGHSPPGFDQWEYVPFTVPEGVRRVSVRIWFAEFATPVAGNGLDLGLFGPAGRALGNAAGFRGWSGGARREFTVSAADATPGYLPGPVESGEWAVALGPIVVDPRGMEWRVRVELEYGAPPPPVRPAPAPERVPGRGPGWYRGDMHVHTVHSDGECAPADVAALALQQGLDFLASTEHNTRSAALEWGTRVPPDLLLIDGEEVTTRHGHWLAIGLGASDWMDWRYGPASGAEFAARARRVRASGGVVAAAHPTAASPGSGWEFGYDEVDAVEVWNGPWSTENAAALGVWDALLRSGRHVVAVGNSDYHRPDQRLGLPQNVVRADELSTAAILDSVRRGHCYLADSAEVELEVKVHCGRRVAGIGEELAMEAGDTGRLVATVRGTPGASLVAYTASGRVATAPVGRGGTGTLAWTTRGSGERYARVEVRDGQRVRALANPVWLVAA